MIATNTTVDPQPIVVEVVLPTKEELIVGTRVPTDVKIARSTKPTQLADLKGGRSSRDYIPEIAGWSDCTSHSRSITNGHSC